MVESIMTKLSLGRSDLLRALAAVAAAFLLSLLTWYLWYRIAGYTTLTVTVAQTAVLALAVGLAFGFRLKFRWIGLGLRGLGLALLITAVAYAAVIGVALIVRAAGTTTLQILRPRYELLAFLDNWGLTAFGEELLFAGVICTLTLRVFDRQAKRGRRWFAVPIVAIIFALWHLPGYLAIGHAGSALIGRLGLNLASWLVFGTVYLLSGNLWLVVLAHAATDYGVTPLITNEPVFGLVFMAILIAGAWRIGWRRIRKRRAPD